MQQVNAAATKGVKLSVKSRKAKNHLLMFEPHTSTHAWL